MVLVKMGMYNLLWPIPKAEICDLLLHPLWPTINEHTVNKVSIHVDRRSQHFYFAVNNLYLSPMINRHSENPTSMDFLQFFILYYELVLKKKLGINVILSLWSLFLGIDYFPLEHLLKANAYFEHAF